MSRKSRLRDIYQALFIFKEVFQHESIDFKDFKSRFFTDFFTTLKLLAIVVH